MVKVKNFFKKVGKWFVNHAPTKRRLIQIYSALLFNCNIKGYFGSGNNIIYRGGLKNLCTPGLNCYSCPGAVTSCPLGALQNALSASGNTAPYYVLGILGLMGLILGRTICGCLCPMGLGQELLHKVKTPKLKKSRYTRILSYFKYVLLAVFVIAIPLIYTTVPGFCKYFCPAGTVASVFQLSNSNNDFFGMLGFLFSWKFILLVIFVVGSIFVYRFFCRFFCPLGAILGFFNKIAFIGVKLDKQKCIDCGLCIQTCQMDINHVGDHECISCGACVNVCPTQAISWSGAKILLHGSQINKKSTDEIKANDTTEAAPKLNALLASGTSVNTCDNSSELKFQPVVVMQSEPAEPVKQEYTKSAQGAVITISKKPALSAKVKKRGFWLQISAWAVALIVLLGSLIYFNFFAPVNASTIFKVGDKLPDFTLTTFDTAGTHGDKDYKVYNKISTNVSSSDTLLTKGMVTVINFWYTTCGPCVAELPGFERVKRDYGDDLNIIAVHAADMFSETAIQKFIDEVNNDKSESWTDWQTIFALDTSEIEVYTMLGGTGAFPMTVIADKEGVITFVKHGSLDEPSLRNAVQAAMAR